MTIRHITAGLALSLLGIAPGAMAFNARGAQRAYGTYNRYGYQQLHATKKFRGMDRNGDGVITRDEWRGNDKSFRKHDRNGDGVISAEDDRGNGQYNNPYYGQNNGQYDQDSEDGHGHGRGHAKHQKQHDSDEDDD